MIFKLDNNPYDEPIDLYDKSDETVELKPGVTVLVGANGTGKTAFIFMLKDFLDEQDIRYFSFNNITDGGNIKNQMLLDKGDISALVTNYRSSEGETILNNIGNIANEIRDYIYNYRIRYFTDTSVETNKRFILFDATDSGLSIDGIIEIKDFLNFIVEDCIDHKPELELYVIISTNNYEMTNGMRCFDVRTCSEISFETYDDFKDFIIKSKEKKLERYSKINEMIGNQKEE